MGLAGLCHRPFGEGCTAQNAGLCPRPFGEDCTAQNAGDTGVALLLSLALPRSGRSTPRSPSSSRLALASLPQPDLEVRSLRNAARQYPCARPFVLSPRAANGPGVIMPLLRVLLSEMRLSPHFPPAALVAPGFFLVPPGSARGATSAPAPLDAPVPGS